MMFSMYSPNCCSTSSCSGSACCPTNATIKKDICCSVMLGFVIISVITIISLILSSCNFTDHNSCPSYDKFSAIMLHSDVASHYNSGYDAVRYYIVQDVIVDNSYNCSMILDDSYSTYSDATDHVTDTVVGSELTVHVQHGEKYGCLNDVPKYDNTGLIIILVILFISLLAFCGYLCSKIYTIYRCIQIYSSDASNYSALGGTGAFGLGMDDEEETVVFAQNPGHTRIKINKKMVGILNAQMDEPNVRTARV